MVKHTQKICRQNPANCLSVFDHFLGLVLKGLRWSFYRKQLTVESTLVLHPTVFAYLWITLPLKTETFNCNKRNRCNKRDLEYFYIDM